MKSVGSLIFYVIISLNFLQGQDDPYIGYFENKQEPFSLEVKKSDDNQYQCLLNLQENTLSFKGTKILGFISGILIYQGKSISYSLAKISGIFYFTLDGNSLVVEKGVPPKSSVSRETNKENNLPDAQWEKRISGKQLLYLYNGNGFSEKTVLNLYPNKTFKGGIEQVSVSQSGSGSTRNSSNGTWKTNKLPSGTWLVLTHQKGTSEHFLLEQRPSGNEINMNGKRFFVTEIK
ncbi:MAG: hypothetical protein KGQ86_06620 [Bacteroidetes bacterium]|nr:hypothetical protein [Bacteroidota bacterium]